MNSTLQLCPCLLDTVQARQREGNKEVSPWPIGPEAGRGRKFKWTNRKREVTPSNCLFVLDVFGAWLPLHPVVSCMFSLSSPCAFALMLNATQTSVSVIYLSTFLLNCKIRPNRMMWAEKTKMIIWVSLHWKFTDAGLIPACCETNAWFLYTFALNGLELPPSHPVLVEI